MVDHLAAPRERVSMKAGNNRPFLWVRECECENCGAKLLHKKKKKKWLDLSQSCSVILALFSEEEKVSGQLPSFSVMGCANVR
jgi:DNA-directed RNA polymerase subunit RPC12/RpoP